MIGTLLLADDSPTIRRVVELTFARENVRVVAVGDGEQAIQRIAVEKPDVVLASIGTARRSGYDVAAFVKAHATLSHVPVLLLASAFEPVDEDRARKAGSAGVLVKPFDPQEVVTRVRDLLGVPAPAAAPAEPRPPVAGAAASVSESRAEDPGLSVSSLESRIPSPEPRTPSLEPGNPSPGPTAAAAAAPAGPAPTAPVAPGAPVAPVAPPESSDPLDDYFDRLDAALTSRAASRPPVPPAPESSPDEGQEAASVPSVSQVLESSPTPAAALEITDELVDQIAKRVVDRLSGDAAKQILTGIVGRLVKDETDR